MKYDLKKVIDKSELTNKQKVMLDYARESGVDFLEDENYLCLNIDEYDRDNIKFKDSNSIVKLDDNKISLSKSVYSINPYKHSHYNYNECLGRTVVITFNEEENSITVKQEDRRSFDYETIGDDIMTDYARYIVESDQNISEYKIVDKTLEVNKGSIHQSVREDSMGGGDWIIVDFNKFSDFTDPDTLRYVSSRFRNINISNEKYNIPENGDIITSINLLEKNSKIKK